MIPEKEAYDMSCLREPKVSESTPPTSPSSEEKKEKEEKKPSEIMGSFSQKKFMGKIGNFMKSKPGVKSPDMSPRGDADDEDEEVLFLFLSFFDK